MAPDPLDLRAASQASSRPPMRSPRQHIAGEAPPELSPLDAFALQSRLLAKQLGETNPRSGRRVSRLPPLNDQSPLIVQARSDYFRSMSNDSASTDQSHHDDQHGDGLGLRTEIEDSFGEDRPVSVHPQMSGIPPPVFEDIPVPVIPRDILQKEQERRSEYREGPSEYDIRRDQSPSPMSDAAPAPAQTGASTTNDGIPVSSDMTAPLRSPSMRDAAPGFPSPGRVQRQSQGFDSLGLAPPRPPFQQRSSSGMSSVDTTDEEGPSPMTSSFSSLPPRKWSNGSAISPQPSPALNSAKRSPSVSSEASTPYPRPQFNFSRPMSRVSTPLQDFACPRTPQDGQFPRTPQEGQSPLPKTPHDGPSHVPPTDEPTATPRSSNSEPVDDDSKAATSYIYSKFTLPRGKAVRPSLQPDSQILNLWEQASSQIRGAPPSPPVRPGSAESRDPPGDYSLRGPSLEQPGSVGPAPQPSPNPSRPSTEGGRPPSEDVPRGRTLTSQPHDEMRLRTPMTISTQDSSNTIKPSQKSHVTPASIMEMTAEEHLAKGIECHENGSLSKSTYHLRLAARQNHPTAMLLYALACRHGWGMRVNEKEGVEWLRKAAEYAGLEIADDDNQQKEGKQVDFLQAKTRKAQFALSIYELGVSHMNGWGTEQDRGLALRCFEIAGCKFFFPTSSSALKNLCVFIC